MTEAPIRLIAVCMAFVVALLLRTAFAEDPNAAKPIIVEHCVKCHDVPGYPAGRGSPALPAPHFSQLAEQSDVYTRDRLRAFLRAPHWPMTQLILSNSDIENLISFIENLRTAEDGPAPEPR